MNDIIDMEQEDSFSSNDEHYGFNDNSVMNLMIEQEDSLASNNEQKDNY